MLISIDIPNNFIKHYNNDKFIDSLERIRCDIRHLIETDNLNLSAMYELELIEMLIDSFKKSKKYCIYDYEIEDIKCARALMQAGISPHELKEHKHDFEYVFEKVRNEFDKELDQCLKLSLNG